MHVQPPATTEPMLRSDSTASTLSGRWLVLARVVWAAVAVLAVGLFAAGVPARYAELRSVCADGEQCAIGRLYPEDVQTLGDLGFSVGSYAAYTLTLEAGFFMVFFASAAVIFWRKSDEWVALVVALFLMAFGGTFPGVAAALPAAHPDWWLPLSFVELLGWVSLFLFFYLFPDGRFVPHWTRWLAVVTTVWGILFTFFPDSPFSMESANPIPPSGFVMFLLFVSTGLFAQIYRYRRVSSMVQRQQTKWVVFGVVAAWLVAFGLLLPFFVYSSLNQPGSLYNLISTMPITLSVLLIPFSIDVAILKYRLFDIDLIINRTLVYGSLTVMLGLLYFGGVATTQAIFVALTGKERQSQLAVVVSTLAIAALFMPMRRRIQSFIDSRFYRSKYDARKTLETFSAQLRNETDLDALSGNLVGVVRKTMQPEHVSLWLHPDPALKDKNKRAAIRESGRDEE